MLSSSTFQAETLNLGERAKLNQRGTNLLLDLIKASDLRMVKIGDCNLHASELQQIRSFLQDEVILLSFQSKDF